MNKHLWALVAGLIILPVVLGAQQAPQGPSAPPANPITASEKGLY